MNTSTEFFDDQLCSIEHYQKFPVMRPFIGMNYGQISGKILLIAESHYLPPNSTINKIPENWYSSTQKDLSTEEIEWINTRKIIGGNWKPAGHMIFKELNNQISKFIDTSEFRAMSSIAFMNGFQRPAPVTGDSIKNFCSSMDYKIGAETIERVINIIQPDLVIFVSKLTWDRLGSRLLKAKLKTDFDFVCHPGTGGRYWHNKKYKHGVNKFHRLLENEVNKMAFKSP
jgi:hypothetical protein